MKPFAIAIHFDIFEHLVFGFRTGFKAFSMHCFDLETVVPTFHRGIVITSAFLAHATDELVFIEQFVVNS